MLGVVRAFVEEGLLACSGDLGRFFLGIGRGCCLCSEILNGC